MRSKDIVSIIAFISAFAVSAAFASLFIDKSQYENYSIYTSRNYSNCRYADQTCKDILSLLVRDISNGRKRQENYDYSLGKDGNVSPKYAETVAVYADASGSLDDEHLPADFQSAWREHMQAWRDYSDFLNEVSENKIEDEAFDRLEDIYTYKINKTWAAVLKIGRGYGASSPYVY